MLIKLKVVLLIALSIVFQNGQSQESAPVKIGIAGLTHGHVAWILGRGDRGDIEVVGIAESNRELATRLSKRFNFSMDLVYPSLEEMIEATGPEAVTAFNSTYEHLEVVETCAPKGIHVMVEKPLAVSVDHAMKMKDLAEKNKIYLITNYETTWYPTNLKPFQMVNADSIGEIRKVVIHDGHKGPKEIGVNNEFLEWLTNPTLNGAGALYDFGCYGANLITWLMNGEKPLSVTAVTSTNKPEIYKQVDDEATIILQYPKAQAIIQASWNWPFSRKDMEIYGETGTIFSDNRRTIRYKLDPRKSETEENLPPRPVPYDDPFSFFSSVVKGEVEMDKYDLSSIENNLIVVEILEAARKSSKVNYSIKL